MITREIRMFPRQSHTEKQQLRNHDDAHCHRKDRWSIHSHSIGVDHREQQRTDKARCRRADDGQRAKQFPGFPRRVDQVKRERIRNRAGTTPEADDAGEKDEHGCRGDE